MTHLTLQINSSILEHSYNEEKNIMIRLQHQKNYFPVFISFDRNICVSFHFFPPVARALPDDANYNEKIGSALATVILFNVNNFELTKESWGLFSPSHPIVVIFPINAICKLFENKDEALRKSPQIKPSISLKCKPNYPIPYNIAYDYLFPSEKLVCKCEEIDNSCLVSLIRVFGVLFLKSKKHIFKENIEKCYYRYFANPNRSTFNDFFCVLSDYSSQSTDSFNATSLFNSSKFDEKDIKRIIDLMLDKDAITIIDQEKCLLIKPNENYFKQVQDEIIQEDAKKENQLKYNKNKVMKKRGKNETKQIVAYVLTNPINFILEEERIDRIYLGQVKNAIKILISSSLIEKRDNNQAKIISMDENRIVEIKLGSNDDPLSFKSIYKEKVYKYNNINTLYDCIKNNYKKVQKNIIIKNDKKKTDDDDNSNNNKNDDDDPFIEEEEMDDDDIDINDDINDDIYNSDLFEKNDILLSEDSNNLFAIEKNKIPGVNLNAFPFRFDLHQTLFFSASTNLRPLIELNKTNDNKTLKLSFYDKNKNDTAILREENGKFLIFNAFSKSGDYPMFKVKLSDNKDDNDVSSVCIFWNFKKTEANLLFQSEMPTYETNVDVEKISITSSKLLNFDDGEPSIEIFNAAKINPLEKNVNFTLH